MLACRGPGSTGEMLEPPKMKGGHLTEVLGWQVTEDLPVVIYPDM